MTHLHATYERGSATVELAILAPVLLVLIGLAIVAGRLTTARAAVEHAATVAARQASLARTADAAHTTATRLAGADLAEQGITCQPLQLTVSTNGFRTNVGEPAQVRVTVSCQIRVGDLGVPGLPVTREVTADAASVLDTWRGRT